MIFKNYELSPFADFLLALELSGKQSRMRSKMHKLIASKMNEVEQDRMDLIRQFCSFDSDGNMVTENGHAVFEGDNQDKFQLGYAELLNEDCVIEINAERKEMFNSVAVSILNTEMKFSGKQAVEYDRWCEILEEEMERT